MPTLEQVNAERLLAGKVPITHEAIIEWCRTQADNLPGVPQGLRLAVAMVMVADYFKSNYDVDLDAEGVKVPSLDEGN